MHPELHDHRVNLGLRCIKPFTKEMDLGIDFSFNAMRKGDYMNYRGQK